LSDDEDYPLSYFFYVIGMLIAHRPDRNQHPHLSLLALLNNRLISAVGDASEHPRLLRVPLIQMVAVPTNPFFLWIDRCQ
jgi:hypothetical protein